MLKGNRFRGIGTRFLGNHNFSETGLWSFLPELRYRVQNNHPILIYPKVSVLVSLQIPLQKFSLTPQSLTHQ